MKLYPTNLQRVDETGLLIEWNDGQRRKYPVTQLREQCPCATCREKRNAPSDPLQLPVLSKEEAQPMTISGMSPVGNYAYTITFSDGHDTGIFTLELLRELGTIVE